MRPWKRDGDRQPDNDVMDEAPIRMEAVEEAGARLRGLVLRTPLLPLAALSNRLGSQLIAKPEYLQPTGSFKLRGAANALLQLDAAARTRGVVAASTGNHGRAVAHMAHRLGIPCTICMSELVPLNKQAGVAAEGAEIRIAGRSQDDAQRAAERLSAARGLTPIPPFDHPAVIAGQGTIGLEIIADLSAPDRILVPLSGGGLTAGIALAVKSLAPATRVIGVSMARGAAMAASLKAGHPVDVEEVESLADSLGGGIGLANRYSFAMVRRLVDEVVLVAETEIAAAITQLYRLEQIVCEGAAAVGLAALMAGRIPATGTTVLVLSGRNIDIGLHHRLVAPARES
jgi:threonine dehydratase